MRAPSRRTTTRVAPGAGAAGRTPGTRSSARSRARSRRSTAARRAMPSSPRTVTRPPTAWATVTTRSGATTKPVAVSVPGPSTATTAGPPGGAPPTACPMATPARITGTATTIGPVRVIPARGRTSCARRAAAPSAGRGRRRGRRSAPAAARAPAAPSRAAAGRRGQRHVVQRGEERVVVADDRDVAGDADAGVLEPVEHARRRRGRWPRTRRSGGRRGAASSRPPRTPASSVKSPGTTTPPPRSPSARIAFS